MRGKKLWKKRSRGERKIGRMEERKKTRRVAREGANKAERKERRKKEGKEGKNHDKNQALTEERK